MGQLSSAAGGGGQAGCPWRPPGPRGLWALLLTVHSTGLSIPSPFPPSRSLEPVWGQNSNKRREMKLKPISSQVILGGGLARLTCSNHVFTASGWPRACTAVPDAWPSRNVSFPPVVFGRVEGGGRRGPLPSQGAAGLPLGRAPGSDSGSSEHFLPSSVHSRPSPGKGHQL